MSPGTLVTVPLFYLTVATFRESRTWECRRLAGIYISEWPLICHVLQVFPATAALIVKALPEDGL